MLSAYFPSWHKNSVSSWMLTRFWQPGSQWMWHREAHCITDSYYKYGRQLINKTFWAFSIILWRATTYLSVAVVYHLHMEIILLRILGVIKVSELNLSRGHWGFLSLRISKYKKYSLLCVTQILKHNNQSRYSWHQEIWKHILYRSL